MDYSTNNVTRWSNKKTWRFLNGPAKADAFIMKEKEAGVKRLWFIIKDILIVGHVCLHVISLKFIRKEVLDCLL